jgi:hypothetical protein
MSKLRGCRDAAAAIHVVCYAKRWFASDAIISQLPTGMRAAAMALERELGLFGPRRLRHPCVTAGITPSLKFDRIEHNAMAPEPVREGIVFEPAARAPG